MDAELDKAKVGELTAAELKRLIGLGHNELLLSSHGFVDILTVADGVVRYGFLGNGRIISEGIDKFLARFESSELVDPGNEYGRVMGKSDRLK